MKTTDLYLKGKCKWAKVHSPDLEYKQWSIVLYPDDESLAQIHDLKSQGQLSIKNTLKKDEDGYHMAFRRPTEKVFKGKLTAFRPPEVLDGAHLDQDGRPLPFREQIGNGSDVTVKLSYYEHGTPSKQRARAVRLEAVRVDNLVPWRNERDFDADAQEQIAGLAEQPVPLF